MTELPANSNGRKGANRRYRIGLLIIILGTIDNYIVIFRKLSIDHFIEYAKFLLLVGGFIAGAITITDAITKWKNGNGGQK